MGCTYEIRRTCYSAVGNLGLQHCSKEYLKYAKNNNKGNYFNRGNYLGPYGRDNRLGLLKQGTTNSAIPIAGPEMGLEQRFHV